MTQFILVRHGQTEWNRVERFRGWADDPLNETGLAQAEATGRRVAKAWRPVAIYSSRLGRAVKTAEAIAKHLDLPVKILSGLLDIDFGDWTRLYPDEARQLSPVMIDRWYNHPELVRIPNGENLSEVRHRAMQTIRDLTIKHPNDTIVLVGHTVVNRIILLGVLGLGNTHFWKIRQDTCAINIFEDDAGDFILVSLNDTCHLNV